MMSHVLVLGVTGCDLCAKRLPGTDNCDFSVKWLL